MNEMQILLDLIDETEKELRKWQAVDEERKHRSDGYGFQADPRLEYAQGKLDGLRAALVVARQIKTPMRPIEERIDLDAEHTVQDDEHVLLVYAGKRKDCDDPWIVIPQKGGLFEIPVDYLQRNAARSARRARS